MNSIIKNVLLSLSVFFFFSCSSVKEKDATIIFSSDEEIELEIYDPIDGMPNMFYITQKLLIKPGHPIIHKVKIDDFAYFRFSTSWMQRQSIILLTEDSTTKVNYSKGKFVFDGDNMDGINYLNRDRSPFHDLIMEVMNIHIKDSINFESLDNDIRKMEIDFPYKVELSKMFEEKKISKQFYETISLSMEYKSKWILGAYYDMAARGQINKYTPTKEEKDKLFERVEQLYTSPLMLDINAPKQCYYFPGDYYVSKYKKLSTEEQEEFNRKNDISAFGNLAGILLAPSHIQLSQLAGGAIFEFQNGVGALYNEKFVEWLHKTFPDKEHTAILTKLWQEKQDKASKKANSIFIDRETVNSFKDIVETEDIKGKTLYIDMWASWCSPCLAQFKHNEQVHQILGQYKDVVTVYISIDEDENNETWKQQIDFHQLNGYHLRATKPFVEYLSQTLYKGGSVGVPRYLIVDKDGNILNDNLPRPSQAEELKQALDKVL